jgi:hypothetical protein
MNVACSDYYLDVTEASHCKLSFGLCCYSAEITVYE